MLWKVTRSTRPASASWLRRAPAGSPLRYSEHSDENGATMLKHACKMGLEGIVSKRKDLPYRSGRGEHWLKIKCVQARYPTFRRSANSCLGKKRASGQPLVRLATLLPRSSTSLTA